MYTLDFKTLERLTMTKTFVEDIPVVKEILEVTWDKLEFKVHVVLNNGTASTIVVEFSTANKPMFSEWV